jgi:hypothetical protein
VKRRRRRRRRRRMEVGRRENAKTEKFRSGVGGVSWVHDLPKKRAAASPRRSDAKKRKEKKKRIVVSIGTFPPSPFFLSLSLSPFGYLR